MKKLITLSLASVMLLSASTGNLMAQSPTAPALNFNVFTLNGVTVNSGDCEGPMAMGGNLTINGSYVVAANQLGTFQVSGKYIGLVIGGSVNYNSGNSVQVNQNGYVKIGTANSSTVWYTDQNNASSPMRITPGSNYNGSPRIEMQANRTNVAGTSGTVSAVNNPVFQSNVIDFTTAFNTMQATATSIAACTDNADLRNGNNQTIPHTGLPNQVKIQLNNGVNVLNLTGADMNNVQNFTFNNQPSSSKILIINVNAPGSFTWNAWTNGGFGGQTNCQYILYNFYNTTNLTIGGNGAIEGTVFAPYASVNKTSYNNLEGQLIALSYSSVGGESHYAVFQPSYSGCAASTTPPVTSFTTNNSTQCLSGNSFTFTSSTTGTGPFTYAWSFGDNTTSTSQNPSKTYSAAGTYTVQLITTGAGGADTATQTVTVNTTPSQPGAFTASSATTYQGQVNVTYTVPSVTGMSYIWTYSGTGATISGTGNSVTIDFSTTATSGTLSVKASNSCGQSTARTMNILVKPYMTWTCSSNNNWNNAANWDGGFVPYGTISVLIPANASCAPNVPSNLSCRDITVEDGAGVTIDCGDKLTVTGNMTINGSVCGCGYLSLAGSATQNLSGNGSVCKLELDNNDGATITSGDTIHIVKEYKPTDGTLVTNGGLELLSDVNETAVILQGNGCNYISGTVTVDKYIPGKRAFRFFAHPFNASIGLDQLMPYIDITGDGGSVNGFTPTATNNPSAFWYNPVTANGSTVNDTSGWIAYTSTDGNGANAWKKAQGARILVRGAKGEGLQSCCNYTPTATTVKMNGEINQCDVTVTATDNNNKGFNFIGNPYACNIDMSTLTRGSSIRTSYSVWDPNQGIAGAYIDQPFSYSYILPAYASFFVRTNYSWNNTITFHESSKTNASATNGLFKTTSGFGNNAIQLHIMSNHDSVSWDRLLIFFDDQAQAISDERDAEKMGNPNLDFYTFSQDNVKQSIDTRPMVDQEVIKLGFETDILEHDFSIRVDDYDVPAGAQVYLHDKFLNIVQPLSSGMHYDFTVTSDPLSQGTNRFELNVSEDNTTNSVNTIANGNFKLSMLPNPASSDVRIDFNAPEQGAAMIQINNLLGQQVYTQALGNLKSGTVNVPVAQLPAGVYMVTVRCGNYTATERLVKQ